MTNFYLHGTIWLLHDKLALYQSVYTEVLNTWRSMLTGVEEQCYFVCQFQHGMPMSQNKILFWERFTLKSKRKCFKKELKRFLTLRSRAKYGVDDTVNSLERDGLASLLRVKEKYETEADTISVCLLQ